LLKDRNVLITLITIVITWIGSFYVYSNVLSAPIKTDIQQTKDKIKALESQLAEAKAKAEQLNKLKEEMAGLQLEVATLEKQLPRTQELPSLLRLFTNRFESYGLFVSSLGPGKPVSKGLYDEIPFTLSFSTTFHNLGKFLTSLGKNERLMAARLD